MQFVKYPSIINTFRGDSLDYIRLAHSDELSKVTWNVYEKIHGANFSMWCNGKQVKFAKRSGFLDKDEKFFNYQYVADKYLANLLMLNALVGKPIVVYGELFGGAYNNLREGTLVQKGVQYCPHNDFAIFDIATIIDNNITFLSEDDLHGYALDSGFRLAPYLATYDSLDDAIAHKKEFVSYVPSWWSLVSVPDNWAEGVVIKPSTPLFTNNKDRIIFKNKNALFKEGGENVIESCVTDTFSRFATVVQSNITKNRLHNVISKVGGNLPLPVYFNELITDAINDANQQVYDTLSDNQKRVLTKYLSPKAWSIINETFDVKEKINVTN